MRRSTAVWLAPHHGDITAAAAAAPVIQSVSAFYKHDLSRETPTTLDPLVFSSLSFYHFFVPFVVILSSQVVRCAIISLAKEAGGRHIELSLRASVLNKGLSLSQLTKGSGVYGSVTSAEDHGYVVSLGLDGVTAFLPKKDAPEAGLEAGQPVEAVIQASRDSVCGRFTFLLFLTCLLLLCMRRSCVRDA